MVDQVTPCPRPNGKPKSYQKKKKNQKLIIIHQNNKVKLNIIQHNIIQCQEDINKENLRKVFLLRI